MKAVRRSHLLAGVAIGALLSLFAGLACSAARRKSATFDDPLHLVGAFVHRHHGDFRIDMEDPPLWHYWALVPTRRTDLKLTFDGAMWQDLRVDYDAQWPFAHEVLYRTAGTTPT